MKYRIGFRMQWQVPEWLKRQDEYRRWRCTQNWHWKCPWFYSNIKDLSSSSTFYQVDKKVRNELVAFWWPEIVNYNILKVIYKGREKNMLYPIAKLVLRYMRGLYYTLFKSLLTAQRVSHCMILVGWIAPHDIKSVETQRNTMK